MGKIYKASLNCCMSAFFFPLAIFQDSSVEFFFSTQLAGEDNVVYLDKEEEGLLHLPVPRIFDKQPPFRFNFNCSHLVENNTL